MEGIWKHVNLTTDRETTAAIERIGIELGSIAAAIADLAQEVAHLQERE